MADPKSIHEFTSGEGALGSLFLMDSPDQQASSGYTTEKLAMTDLGDFLNNEMEYTQDLDTETKKISGALNELHGVDGFDVYDETTTSANKYEQGDICIHNNTLQVCTDAAGAYGAWDSTKWSPTTIKALLAQLRNDLTVTTITASEFFDSADLSKIDANEFYAYRIGKMVFVERCKILDVTLVSPTYKIVGVKSEYLPTANIRICGQFETSGQLDNPYRMFLSPVYGIGSEKWGTYASIWLYSFSYLIN